ncbi:IgGFc-binding protein isoform X5 [Magallana gigas]|uniref:IgGFc-binding protein isoform X5 n=1 Tax=Magallana gigas TaxID=29159 RepID=UPI0033422B22
MYSNGSEDSTGSGYARISAISSSINSTQYSRGSGYARFSAISSSINSTEGSRGSGYARFSAISSSINSTESIEIYTAISSSTSTTYDNISEGYYDRQIGQFITPNSRNSSNQEHTKDSKRQCFIVILSVFAVVISTTVATIAVLYLQGQDDKEDTSSDDVRLSPNNSFPEYSSSTSSSYNDHTKPLPEYPSTTSSPYMYHNTTKPSADHLPGSWGTRFIVLFMQNIRNTKKSIYVTSVNGIRINVTTSERLNSSLKSEIDQTTSIYSFEQFLIPNSMELEGFKIETKCVLIETSQNSMVVSQADVYSSVGMTTHIPIHKLSTTYVIVSTNPVKYFSQFAVASINENTMISITFQMNDTLQIDGKIYRSGETFSIKLNCYETYQIQHTVDLTGTFVQSSLPIAVFSGNDCNKLNGQGFCDHLIEQLPPTSRIDAVYVVPPHLYSNTKIRIIAIDKSTIFYNCTNKTLYKSYKRMEYFDIDISSNGVCYIQSNGPILVASFGLSSSIRYISDPSMVIVPGFHQYQNYYKIIVPFGYDYSYITVIMEQSDSLLLLNGYTVASSNILYQEFLYYSTHFKVMIIRVFAGELTVTTTKSDKFGLMCAGMNFFKSFAFSGNSVL